MEFRQGQLVILRSEYPDVICVWVWPDIEDVYSIPNETYGMYIGISSYQSLRHEVLVGEQIVSISDADLVPI